MVLQLYLRYHTLNSCVMVKHIQRILRMTVVKYVSAIIFTKTKPNMSPSWATSGMSFVRIWVTIDRVITVLHCIYITRALFADSLFPAF